MAEVSLTREGALGKWLPLVGNRDLQIGDKRFDRAVEIGDDIDEAHLFAILDPETRDKLVALWSEKAEAMQAQPAKKPAAKKPAA